MDLTHEAGEALPGDPNPGLHGRFVRTSGAEAHVGRPVSPADAHPDGATTATGTRVRRGRTRPRGEVAATPVSPRRAALGAACASGVCPRITETDLAAPPDFAAFARQEHPRLVGALTLYCGDVAVAEELAQDALVRCRERWSRVAGAHRPGASAHRVAINLANSRFRRRRAERRALERVAGGVASSHEDPCSAEGLAVRRAVSSLPVRQREVVVRRFFLDEDVATVAEAMGVATSSVRSATSRALETLRAEFDVVLPGGREAHDVS